MSVIPVGAPVVAPVAGQQLDPRAALDALPAVYIMQDISLTEVLSGCEMRNKYKVYAADPATLEKVPGKDAVFRSVEESSCFQRQCCGSHREFNMDTFVRDLANPEEGRGPTLSQAFRPFKCCEFLCFNRPEVFVKNGTGQQIGYVRSPFTLCSWDVDVAAPDGSRTDQGPLDPEAAKGDSWPYKITATCCQVGIYCRLPCGPCKRVIFEIKDRSGATVGEIQHVWAGCCKSLVDVDNYAIRFPAGATWYQKATLINAVYLVDFLYFERKQGDASGAM